MKKITIVLALFVVAILIFNVITPQKNVKKSNESQSLVSSPRTKKSGPSIAERIKPANKKVIEQITF